MGKKINISQPVVINTTVTPLDESFWIEASGTLEQMYNSDTKTYIPNRNNTPLILTPRINVSDINTQIVYSSNNGGVAFYTVTWYKVNYSSGGGETTEKITDISANSDYYISNSFNLAVRKNVEDSNNGVTIKCVARYIDPRDNGSFSSEITEYVHLGVNKNGTALFPKITIQPKYISSNAINEPNNWEDATVYVRSEHTSIPSKILYNPFGSKFYENMNPYRNNNYIFDVRVGIDGLKENGKQYYFRWFCSLDNKDFKEAYKQPCIFSYTQPTNYAGVMKVGNVDATCAMTNTISIDARYGDVTRIKVQLFEFSNNTEIPLPVQEQFSIFLKLPTFGVLVSSDKGNVVNNEEKEFVFSPIINTNLGLIENDDKRVKDNLRFKWYSKKQGVSGSKNELGIGINEIIPSSKLKHKNGSMQVWCDVLFCGTFQKVVHGKKEVCWFESASDFEDAKDDFYNDNNNKGKNFFYSEYFAQQDGSESYEIFGNSIEESEESIYNEDTIPGLE